MYIPINCLSFFFFLMVINVRFSFLLNVLLYLVYVLTSSIKDFTKESLCMTSWKIFLKEKIKKRKKKRYITAAFLGDHFKHRTCKRLLTGQEWRFHLCEWPCPEECRPRCPSSRERSARTACTAAGCTCARGTAASAWLCWCPHQCEWWGKASRAPGGTAGRSCPWRPEEKKRKDDLLSQALLTARLVVWLQIRLAQQLYTTF